MPRKPDFGNMLDEQTETAPNSDFQAAYGDLKLPEAMTNPAIIDWFQPLPNALIIQRELTEEEWFRLVEVVESVKRRYQWYLGDCMVYGIQRNYGRTAEQIQRIMVMTGKDDKTLHDYYKTALLFQFSERSENLKFEQHRVLARAYPENTPDHQKARLHWLKQAEEKNLSGRRLFAAIYPESLPPPAPPLLDKINRRRFGKLWRLSERGQLEKIKRDDIRLMRAWLDELEKTLPKK